MGADLITTYLWFELGPEEERTVGANTYRVRPPKLDWAAGRRAATTLVRNWDDGKLETYLNQDDDTLDGDEDTPVDRAAKVADATDRLLKEFDELKADFDQGGRDIDGRTFLDVGFYMTGGMSWGDGPTETYDRWTRWYDDDEYGIPEGHKVMAAIGFIEPQHLVGLVGPKHHSFISDDGYYCTVCSLPEANWRHRPA